MLIGDESLRIIVEQGPLSMTEWDALNKYEKGAYLAYANAALRDMGPEKFSQKREALKREWQENLRLGMVADPTPLIEKLSND